MSNPFVIPRILGSCVFLRTRDALNEMATAMAINKTGPKIRGITKGLLIGLVTYWIQGALNYFLDTEKSAVPYWGFIAAIVAIDLYHSREEKEVANKGS